MLNPTRVPTIAVPCWLRGRGSAGTAALTDAVDLIRHIGVLTCRDIVEDRDSDSRIRGVMAKRVGQRNATWSYRTTLPKGGDGKHHQSRKGGFPTERAARLARARALSNATPAEPVNDSVTFSEAAAAYLNSAKGKLRVSTY